MFNAVKMVLIKHLMILLRDGDAGQDVVQKYLQGSGHVGLVIGQGVFCSTTVIRWNKDKFSEKLLT